MAGKLIPFSGPSFIKYCETVTFIRMVFIGAYLVFCLLFNLEKQIDQKLENLDITVFTTYL